MEVAVAGEAVFCHTGGVPFDPGHPGMVLIHGAGQDHSYFRFQTRWLAHRGVAAVAPDLPGHGRSAGEPLETIPAMSAWLLSLLDILGLDRTALLGHSMGALVAVETAATAPDRVDLLILTGPSDAMGVHPDLQAAADDRDPLAVELITGWTHSSGDRFGGHPQPGSWSAGVTRRLDERQLARALGTDLRACATYRAADRASEVRCPTAVVVGTGDRMTPGSAGRRLAAAIPDARLVEVAGAGHSVLFDHPDVVNRVVGEALELRTRP